MLSSGGYFVSAETVVLHSLESETQRFDMLKLLTRVK